MDKDDKLENILRKLYQMAIELSYAQGAYVYNPGEYDYYPWSKAAKDAAEAIENYLNEENQS